MKSYLSLIALSAKVHKRQNRMTVLCIIFSVFMVTAVFSMAEMGARMEQTRLLDKHENLSFQALFSSAMGQTLLLTAIFLFFLILFSGVLMIASSLNSSVAQRTRFFGMMRCIGMSKQQIIRFIRLEALYWCKTAVPAGVVLGVAATWGLCAALRFLVGEEFSHIPLFGISIMGIISGVLVGVVTVLIAARAPAKRAAKVSPVTAVSGNTESVKTARHAVSSQLFKIETALGCRHAISARKNLLLMTGSFALSIILFLSFSVLVDFVNYLMPQSAGASDIDIASSDGSNSIDCKITDTLSRIPGIDRVYGRRSCFNVPAGFHEEPVLSSTVDIVSFDDFDLECLAADKVLKKGSDLSKVYGDSRYVLAAWDPSCAWKIGDKIQVGSEELEIAGLLQYDPFSSDGLTNGKLTLVVSGETFTRLTGVTGYSLLMLQTASGLSEESIRSLRDAVSRQYEIHDKRDQSTAGTYLAFVVCVYGFLAIIILVTGFNIVNSISMSVSARMKQYGAMRAVGMDGRQISKMIMAEAFTYAFGGCVVGCAVGLPFSKLLYDRLIATHFSYAAWHFPTTALVIILLFVCFAALTAAYAPSKRIRNNSITETINEL